MRGAHLGFRLSSHDAAGGWAYLACHEDVDLYQRLRATGARSGAASRAVLTSSRPVGRTAGGFATYLSTLDHAWITPGSRLDRRLDHCTV